MAAAAAGAAAAAACGSTPSRSLATILPFGPEPLIPFKEIPFSKAIVLANGDAIILSVGAFLEDGDGVEAGAEVEVEAFGSSFFGASSSAAGAGFGASPASAAVKFSNAATSPASST